METPKMIDRRIKAVDQYRQAINIFLKKFEDDQEPDFIKDALIEAEFMKQSVEDVIAALEDYHSYAITGAFE